MLWLWGLLGEPRIKKSVIYNRQRLQKYALRRVTCILKLNLKSA